MKTLPLEHGNSGFLTPLQAYSSLLGIAASAAAWLAGGCGSQDASQASLLPLVSAQVGLLAGSTGGFLSRLRRRVAGSLGAGGSESSTQRRYLKAVVKHRRHVGFPRTLAPHSPGRIEMQAAFVRPRLALLHSWAVRAAKPPQGDPGHAQDGDIWTCLQDARQHGQNLVILGPPGGGKTTLLQYVALALTSQPKNSESSAHGWMPALVSLAKLPRELIEKPAWSLADAIVAQTRLPDWTPPRDWVEGQLAADGLVVLLDGLDEQADPHILRLVRTWVEKQVQAYSATLFVLTATPSGYRQGGLPECRLSRLQPFGDEQRRQFLRKRPTGRVPSDQNGHGAGDSEVGYEQADSLSRYIGQTPHLAQLVERPLHLAMLTLAYEEGCDQPSSLEELYGQACEILWRETPSHALPTDPSALRQSRTPQSPLPLSLAFVAMRAGRTAAPADGREATPTASVPVVERAAGTCSFAHPSIQHFLAATYLRTEADDSEILALPDTPTWKEVLRFYCREVDGRRILRTCLSRDQPSPDVIRLAATYLQETGAGDYEIRDELEHLLNQSAQGADSLTRQAAESALFDLRLGRGGDSGEALGNPITTAEYQVFLDSNPMAGARHRPDHWTGGHRPQQAQPAASVAGVRAEDAVAFCRWLTDRQQSGWTHRLPRLGEELDASEDQGEIPATGYWVASDSPDTYMVKGAPPPAMTYSAAQLSRDLALELPDEMAFDLDRSLARLLARAQARARAEARVLDLDLDRPLRRSTELARDLEENHEIALALGHTFARDFDSDLTLTSQRAEGLSYHDPNLDRDRSTAHQLARILSNRLSRPSEQQRVLARALGVTLSLDHILDVARGVDRAVRLVHRRDHRLIETVVRETGSAAGWREIFRFLWSYVTSRSLLLTLQLTYARRALPANNWSERMRQDTAAQQINERIQSLVNHYSDLFVEFITLKRRMEGEIAAFEGIRIVRERSGAM